MTAASPFVFPSRTWQPHLPLPVGHTPFPISYLLEKFEPTHPKPSLFSKHGQTTDLQIEGMEVESRVEAARKMLEVFMKTPPPWTQPILSDLGC